jgi:heme O synthase-like polyprenyltransferase
MTIFKNKKIFAWVMSFIFILPFLTYAAEYTFNGLLPTVCTDSSSDTKCNFEAIMATINHALNWVIGMAGVIAAITFTIAGAQMLLNPDNPGKRADAIEMFKKTAIGLIIVLSAWLVITTSIKALIDEDLWKSFLKFFNI